MATNGIYIYGIVPNFYGAEHFRSLEYAGVYAIPLQNISAIVSDWDVDSIDYSNRESLAHQLVHHQLTIERVMTLGFTMILPMKLGTFVNVKEEVLTILAKGHDLFISSFNQIENMTEIDLTVTWGDFGGILKELSSNPEIIALRESILQKDESFSQADQVKTGMLVREKLNERNKQVELKILDVLSSFSTNLKLHDVMNDQMITNAAFLINRNVKEKFELMIDQLDAEFGGMLNFKLIGPLPCYSFYTIEVKELSSENIAYAKKELGLGEEASESVIKKAYLEYAKLFHPDTHKNDGTEERFRRINKAYHTLLEYSLAVKQSSELEYSSLVNDKAIQKVFLIKMKE
jgi:hypothetical protein